MHPTTSTGAADRLRNAYQIGAWPGIALYSVSPHTQARCDQVFRAAAAAHEGQPTALLRTLLNASGGSASGAHQRGDPMFMVELHPRADELALVVDYSGARQVVEERPRAGPQAGAADLTGSDEAALLRFAEEHGWPRSSRQLHPVQGERFWHWGDNCFACVAFPTARAALVAAWSGRVSVVTGLAPAQEGDA